MSILSQLSSVTKDKNSNKEIVEKCLEIRGLLHTLAEGFRTGSKEEQIDCMQILTEVAKKKPGYLIDLTTDLIKASKIKNKKINKLAFQSLVYLVPHNPADIYAQREYFLEIARKQDSNSLTAFSLLASLCANNTYYRGQLAGTLIFMLKKTAIVDMIKWVKALKPAVEGSQDGIKKLKDELSLILPQLPEEISVKIEKVFVKYMKTLKR
ncbi:MAG: hypothetical protein ABIA04_03100 [Pseudomonadota bacterium]